MLQLKEKVLLKDKNPDELIRVRLIYGIRTPFKAEESLVYMIGSLYVKGTNIRARVYNEDEDCFHTEDGCRQAIPMKQLKEIAQDAMMQLDLIRQNGEIRRVKKQIAIPTSRNS